MLRSDQMLMPLKTNDAWARKRLRKKGTPIDRSMKIFRAAMIQNEVITSHKKNVEIEWLWNDLEDKEDCEELSKVGAQVTVINPLW